MRDATALVRVGAAKGRGGRRKKKMRKLLAGLTAGTIFLLAGCGGDGITTSNKDQCRRVLREIVEADGVNPPSDQELRDGCEGVEPEDFNCIQREEAAEFYGLPTGRLSSECRDGEFIGEEAGG
jgi:hypothetical protein